MQPPLASKVGNCTGLIVICAMVVQPAAASGWQYPGQGSGLPGASSAAPERTGSLGSLQAASMQSRSFVVTTGDVVIRSTSGQLSQPEAFCQVRRKGFPSLAHPGSVSPAAWMPAEVAGHASRTAATGMGAAQKCRWLVCAAELLTERVLAAAAHAICEAGQPGGGADQWAGSPGNSSSHAQARRGCGGLQQGGLHARSCPAAVSLRAA